MIFIASIVKSMFTRTLFLLIICFALNSAPLHAQDLNIGAINSGNNGQSGKVINPYDPKYRPQANRPAPKGITGITYWLSFVNLPDQTPEEAVLQISQPLAFTGCADIHMPDPDIKDNGSTIWITVHKPIIRLNKVMRLPGQTCAAPPVGISSHVHFNRTALIEQNVQKIAFKNEAVTDYYDVTVTPDMIVLSPQTTNFFKPGNNPRRIDALTKWFYPDNTVILTAPRARNGQNLAEEITALARKKGLAPLDETLKNFENPSQNAKMFYFTDQTGALLGQLDTQNNIRIGTIAQNEVIYGAGGMVQQAQAIEVFARRPGLMD